MSDETGESSAWIAAPKYRFRLGEVECTGVKLVCKLCGMEPLYHENGEQVCSPYCPFCGAKMNRGDTCE